MGYHLDLLRRLRDEAPAKTEEGRCSWAAAVCKASRQVHIQMWSSEFSEKEAREFAKLLDDLLLLISDAKGCEIYGRNISIRRTSIDNYLRGGLPELPPDAPQDERDMNEQVLAARQRIKKAQQPFASAKLARDLGIPFAVSGSAPN